MIRLFITAAMASGLLVSGLAIETGLAAEPSFSKEQIQFFEKEVKPILVANCVKCHGGETDVKGELRLTSRAGLLRGGESGPVVDFESFDDSPLLQAINHDGLEMPPRDKMPDKQIDVLTRWVKMNAPWTPGDGPTAAEIAALDRFQPTAEQQAWWAYQPLEQPRIPDVQNQDRVANPIDAFILAKLDAAGLQPVEPASKQSLIRRAFYDLTGLPPTPGQVQAFVKNDSPDAYEKLIEQLLDSPHYGERWGRHWLDLVRFAETNGYERDGTKPHAWRYRDYVIQSFNDDKPYNRFLLEQLAGDELNPVTAETLAATGYYRLGVWDDEPADRLLAKYDYLDGVVSTTSQVMLGMTVGCARCHNHKVDPIPQADYYRMQAFFENMAWSMRDRAVREIDVTAKAPVELTSGIEKNKAVMEAYTRDLNAALRAAKLPLPGNDDGRISLVKDSRKEPQTWRYTLTKPADDWAAPGFGETDWKQGPGGFGTKGTPNAVVGTTWKTKNIWLRKKFRLTEVPDALALTIHHDEDVSVYLNGVLIFSKSGYAQDYSRVELDARAARAAQTGQNVLAIHCQQTGGGQYIDAGLDAGAMTIARVASTHGNRLLGTERTKAFFKSKETLRTLGSKLPKPAGKLAVLCVAEGGDQPTYILKRGNPHVRGDEVSPGFPQIITPDDPQLPTKKTAAGTSGRRLALARWITSDDNQLTARTIANRIWQHHFGRGIVATPNDFGGLGSRPTHPELLNYLATELVQGGWKLKSLHRKIMLSNAYRMSSNDNRANLAKDPSNQLFWRHEMRRLSSEEIRDSILAANGSLNLKMRGPSIYTKVPQAILQTSSRPGNAWGKSSPADQSRRSVYVFIKRSLAEPFLRTFDAPDTDNSCAVRFATTVPTQALTMLNSEFMQEQSARFADRLRREAGGDPAAQVKLALSLALCRKPTASEVESNLQLISELQKEDQLSADQALNYFCLVVLNLNEFIYLN